MSHRWLGSFFTPVFSLLSVHVLSSSAEDTVFTPMLTLFNFIAVIVVLTHLKTLIYATFYRSFFQATDSPKETLKSSAEFIKLHKPSSAPFLWHGGNRQSFNSAEAWDALICDNNLIKKKEAHTHFQETLIFNFYHTV